MSIHPSWVQCHKKQGTEIKFINGHYYLYGVKSVYNKELKRVQKVSLGILGKITEKDGFIPSKSKKLAEQSVDVLDEKQVFSVLYEITCTSEI